MKKWIAMMTVPAALLFLTACAGERPAAENGAPMTGKGALSTGEVMAGEGGDTMHQGQQIHLIVEGERLTVRLGEGQTAQRLRAMLPAALSFEDFNGTEKIAYPPEKLDTAGDEGGHAPKPGDLCLYKPWGNLCIFYKPWSASNDLIYIGHVEDGLEGLISKSRFEGRLE